MKTELTQSSVSYRCGRMIAIVWLCVVPSIVQAQSKDIIWQRESGEMVSGEILSVDPEIIRIRAKGGIQDIGTEDISKVRFGDDPSGMSGVRSSVDSGQLEQAQKQIRQVKPGGRDFVRQDAAFYRVLIDSRLALNGQGSINAAAKAVNDFLSSNPDSFRYYDASIVMGDLAMTLGRYDVAAKLYGRLTAAKSANRQAEGNLHQGYALLQGGDADGAGKLFRKAASAADSRTQSLARIGMASCMTKQGKAEDAIREIEKVIASYESTDTEMFARAYNALGTAFVASKNDSAALDAFLHTDLLFHREHEQHAEALYHLGSLWSKAQKPAEAARSRRILKERFPASAWAKK